MHKLVGLVGWVLIACTVIAAAEAGGFLYYSWLMRRPVSAAAMYAHQPNAFIEQAAGGGCSYVDTLYPHPFLAHIHRPLPGCGMTMNVNKKGLMGPEYPLERDPSKYSILITGGSVASQFAGAFKKGPNFLEDELNRCYVPPSGSAFAVYNGADGGWKQPIATIMALLYGDAFDALISIEGYNEHWAMRHTRIEFPSSNFVTVNPFVSNSYEHVASVWLGKKLHEGVMDNTILRNSFMAYALVSAIKSHLAEAAAPNDQTSVLHENFALPSDWSGDRKFGFNLRQYQKYVRATASIMAPKRTAFFISLFLH